MTSENTDSPDSPDDTVVGHPLTDAELRAALAETITAFLAAIQPFMQAVAETMRSFSAAMIEMRPALEQLGQVRQLAESQQVDAVGGGRCDADTIWPSEILAILDDTDKAPRGGDEMAPEDGPSATESAETPLTGTSVTLEAAQRRPGRHVVGKCTDIICDKEHEMDTDSKQVNS